MTQPGRFRKKLPSRKAFCPKNMQSWLLRTGVPHDRDHVAHRRQEAPRRPKQRRPAARRKCHSKSTKPRSMSCRTASRNCSANNSWRRARWPSRSHARRLTARLPASPGAERIRQSAGPASRRPDSRRNERGAPRSLFASNVALTYRKTPPTAPAPGPETAPAVQSPVPVGPDSPQVAQLLKQMQPNAISPVPVLYPSFCETIPRKRT